MIAAIVIGLIVGAIAKFLMPGRDPGGFFVTILLGIAGAMVANWIGHSMNVYQPEESAGWIASVLGSVLILAVYRMTLARTA